MSELSRLEHHVDETFHSVILDFDPGTYRKCIETLKDLGQRIESSRIPSASKRSLLVRVKAHMATMASEVKDYEEAERLANEVLGFASTDHPDFALAVLIRTEALHSLGRHEEEVAEALRYVGSKVITGHPLVHLLANLAKRHSESIAWEDSLTRPVKDYALGSPELAKRLRLSQVTESSPKEYILTVASIVRELNFERTARTLREESEG